MTKEDTRPEIKAIIVVEGRDDTAAVKRAVRCETIETHGFGISDETWQRLYEAEKRAGLIVFTDPDFAGEDTRKRMKERFPKAAHAYLTKEDALSGRDIGIENAHPKAIVEALSKVHSHGNFAGGGFTRDDLFKAGLDGVEGAAARRAAVGKLLGIGYGNGEAFLRRLNGYGIEKDAFYEAVSKSRHP